MPTGHCLQTCLSLILQGTYSSPPGERSHEPGWSAQALHGAMSTAQDLGATVVVIPPEDFTAARMEVWRQEGLLGLIVVGERIEAARAQLVLCCSAGIPLVATDLHAAQCPCRAVDLGHTQWFSHYV